MPIQYGPTRQIPPKGVRTVPKPKLSPGGAKAATRAKTGTGTIGGGKNVVAKTPEQMLMALLRQLTGGAMSPAAQQAQIQKGINAQIAAEIEANRAVTRAQQFDLRNREARAEGFSRALGSLTGQEGAQTYADYERAAQNIQGLGTGLTGAVLDAQQAAANSVVGDFAAAGGVGEIKPSFELEGLRNTAQYLGTTAPARDLYSEAANQAAGARLRNVAAAEHIGNIAADFRQQGAQAQEELAAANRKIQAQRPDLYMKAQQAAQEARRSDLATLWTAYALQNTQEATAAEIANDKLTTQIAAEKAKNQTLIDKVNALNQTTKANATGATASAKTTGYVTVNGKKRLAPGYYLPGGPNTVPQPYDTGSYKVVINPDGTQRLVALPPKPGTTPKTPAGKKAWTPTQVQDAIADAAGDLPNPDKLAGYARISNAEQVQFGAEPIYKPTMTLAKAVAQLREYFPAAIRNDARVTRRIKDALANIGYKV